MAKIPKAIYRFNTILIKIPMRYFVDIEQTFQKFIWNRKQPQIAAAISRKKYKQDGSQYQISKTFLYTDNEISETEIRKKIPFDTATRKVKYLGINLTKEVQACTQKTISH